MVVKRGQKGHRMDDLSGLTQKRQVTEDHLLQIFTPDSAESKLTLTHSSNLLCLSELELQNRDPGVFAVGFVFSLPLTQT